MHYLNKTKEKGYAILFTLVIVGVLSMMSLGLADIAYKQLILSSVARDSQISFYQADMASECALYAENKLSMGPSFTTNPWSCGSDLDGNSYQLNIAPYGSEEYGGYSLTPVDTTSKNPCFTVTVDKSSGVTLTNKGYNICDKNNLKTVEREIDVSYE